MKWDPDGLLARKRGCKNGAMISEIKRRRLERGLPQQTVARQARVGQTTFSLYERGIYPVPHKVAVRLARILRVGLDELFVEEDRK
jgi:transcriptional regulator with XRE-family HTH domain